MPDQQPQALFVYAEATDANQVAWAWVIRRQPDQTLILQSRAKYAGFSQALTAGNAAASKIGRKLGIPVANKASN